MRYKRVKSSEEETRYETNTRLGDFIIHRRSKFGHFHCWHKLKSGEKSYLGSAHQLSFAKKRIEKYLAEYTSGMVTYIAHWYPMDEQFYVTRHGYFSEHFPKQRRKISAVSWG